MSVGKNIKKYRKLKKLSQEELGEKIGKSKFVISNWERGENSPDVESLKKITKILNITPNQMYDWKEEYIPPEVIAAHATEDLTEEEREEVRDFIKFVRSKRD